MAASYGIVFVGAAPVAGGWRLIHRARRENRLVTEGVYSRMRHPQTLLARKEERQMIEQFGNAYEDYRERVPMFLPRRVGVLTRHD
jgi:protein-S-isoprenylcysteine O-methyltransferase Ste14